MLRKYGTRSRLTVYTMAKESSVLYDIFRISWEEQISNEGKIIYLHGGKPSMLTAYEYREKARIHIEIPRKLGAKEVKLNIVNEYKDKYITSVSGSFYDTVSDMDIYAFSVPIRKISVGIYYFYIEISSFFDIIL